MSLKMSSGNAVTLNCGSKHRLRNSFGEMLDDVNHYCVSVDKVEYK